MEYSHAQSASIERIPTIDSLGDIDQGHLYINELLLTGLSFEDTELWWDQPSVSLDNKTPYAMWTKDPNAVIRWAHTYVTDLRPR